MCSKITVPLISLPLLYVQRSLIVDFSSTFICSKITVPCSFMRSFICQRLLISWQETSLQ